MTEILNKYSRRITQPKSQGASQAMLYATGMSSEDMNKAQVGIGSVWYEGNSCNMHLLDLAGEVKEGVSEAGLVGMRFNTIGVSDGISMGTERHVATASSRRDLIADIDRDGHAGAVVRRAGDASRAATRTCRAASWRWAGSTAPSIMIYGGTIKPGSYKNEKLDIVSAFQCYGQFIAGQIDEEERQEIVRRSCPGAGACGGDVHRQHDGHRHRGAWHVTALFGQHPGGRRGRKRKSVIAPARRSLSC